MNEMIKVKAKLRDDWSVWIYGIWVRPGVVRDNEGNDIDVIERTVCMDTGLRCNDETVYENDWLEVAGNGEVHKFLAALGEKEFRAYEDEDISYVLANVIACEDCKVVGNLYD